MGLVEGLLGDYGFGVHVQEGLEVLVPDAEHRMESDGVTLVLKGPKGEDFEDALLAVILAQLQGEPIYVQTDLLKFSRVSPVALT